MKDYKDLINQLRKYAIQAMDNHDNYIAEDLRNAETAIALLVAENTYLRAFIKSECPGAELFWADHEGEPGPPGIRDEK